MREVVRVAVQCANPLRRSVVVRYLAGRSGLTAVRLGPAEVSGVPRRRVTDLADALVQVVRAPTPRSMSAAGWAAAAGLAVIVLIDGGPAAACDVAGLGRAGVAAVAPLEAVTGELLRTMILTGVRGTPGGTPAAGADALARYEGLVRAAGADVRWVAARRRG